MKSFVQICMGCGQKFVTSVENPKTYCEPCKAKLDAKKAIKIIFEKHPYMKHSREMLLLLEEFEKKIIENGMVEIFSDELNEWNHIKEKCFARKQNKGVVQMHNTRAQE